MPQRNVRRYITFTDGTPYSPPPPPPSSTTMSSVVTSRATPTTEAASVSQETKVVRDKDAPIDIDIPDNYVSWTLKNQKERPPMSWDNWWKELNYLSLSILTITPAIAIYGALTQPLRWQTAVFSVFYYFVTGLGELSWLSSRSLVLMTRRYHRWVPPALGPPRIQRVEASSVLPCCGRRRRRRGFNQVVVSRPPRAPPLHRHASRPVQRSRGLLVVPHRLDACQAPP